MFSTTRQIRAHCLEALLFVAVFGLSAFQFLQERRNSDEGFIAIAVLVILIAISVSLARLLRTRRRAQGGSQ